MALKGMKPAAARLTARNSLASIDAVAREAGLPPATMHQKTPTPDNGRTQKPVAEEMVQINIRVRRALGDQLADRAKAESTTQKVLLCRALAEAGFQVHPDDLRATPAPRRRGSTTG